MRLILTFLILAFTQVTHADTPAEKANTVILITIDGLRWQEVYRGIDKAFLDQQDYIAYKKHHADFKADYWREDMNERRAALMPFLWGTIAKDGILLGNRDKGSKGSLVNKHHFSYPGYSEILTGIADDERITSNDMILNPNRTLLEWLNAMPKHKGKVEAFGSWDVFPYIIHEARSGVSVNAGFEPYPADDNQHVKFLNDLQPKIPSPWDTVRLDAFTMGYARAALAREKMDFIYIALGETDDFAHDGHYDQYAMAAHRSDAAIADLWAWLQSDPRYAGKTSLLITVDHGRGNQSLEAWKYHGRFPYKKEDGTDAISDFPGDDEVWFAAIGAGISANGEVSGGTPFTLSQVAATAASLMGYTYESNHENLKAGEAMQLGK